MKPKIAIAFALTVIVSGFAIEPKRIEVPPETRFVVQPAEPSETDRLLNYLGRMRKLDAKEFAAERDNARKLFQSDKSDFSRIRYALMLAQPPLPSSPAAAAAQEEAELIGVIEPLVSTPAADSDVRTLAAVLYGICIDRRKMREQLRDSQVRLNLARKDDTRDAEARALRLRIEELEAKLNALKSIDRSVNRRVESPAK